MKTFRIFDCLPLTTAVDGLESDHEEADTLIFLSIINSPVEHITVVSQDTDIFIIFLSN